MKKKNLLTNSLIILFSLIVAFFLIEIIMRITKIEYPIFQTHDYHRGFALRPGASGWWIREGKAFVKINSQGLRDKEYQKEKSPNSIRIALLGDSFAEARSIPTNKTFWSLTENKLNLCYKKNNKKIEIINFGVTEYSSAQELLTLRHHVWDYNPDIVLLAFFSGNDVSDNSKKLTKKKYRPFFVLKDNSLILDNSFRQTKPYLMLKSNLGQLAIKISNYSRIVQISREIYVRYYFKSQAKKNLEKNKKITHEEGVNYLEVFNPRNDIWKNAWELTESIIKLMNKEIKERESKFIVITISTPVQVHPDPNFRKTFKKKIGSNDLFYPDNRINKLGEKEGFKVINLAKPLQRYAEKNQVFLHGFKNTTMGEGHWNEDGHNISSQIISKELCKIL